MIEAKAHGDMKSTVSSFSHVYSDLMKDSVANCRRARIDSDYMPIINKGEYLEFSAVVAKRLMYFLTLLRISLEKDNTNFPKFLLIDTPDTAGIDDVELKKVLLKITEVVANIDSGEWQVILTTGLNTYPDEHKNLVVETITKQDRLLKAVTKELSEPSKETNSSSKSESLEK